MFARSNPIVFCKNAMTVGAGHKSWLDGACVVSIKAKAVKLSLYPR